eukprot:gene15886-biopygen3275
MYLKLIGQGCQVLHGRWRTSGGLGGLAASLADMADMADWPGGLGGLADMADLADIFWQSIAAAQRSPGPAWPVWNRRLRGTYVSPIVQL